MTRPRWRTPVAAPHHARIAVVGDGVFLPSHDVARNDVLARYQLADGERAWEVPLPTLAIDDAFNAVATFGDDATVYLAQGGQVAAFAAADGAHRWDATVPGEAFTADVQLDGDRIYLGSRSSRLVALDRRDGTVGFQTEDRATALDAVVRGGAVITRSSELPDVRAFDAATGAPLWQHAMSAPFPITGRLGTSLALGRTDYLVVDGERAILSLDPKTGAVRWQEPVVGLASYAFAGAVVVVTDGASVRGIDAATGKVHWRHPSGGLSLVAPLDESAVLLALPTAICTVDPGNGTIKEHARHGLHPQDRVLDARAGSVALTTDNGTARWYRHVGGSLLETTIGETVARAGNPAAHGVVQAVIAAGGVVTFDTARELAFFGA